MIAIHSNIKFLLTEQLYSLSKQLVVSISVMLISACCSAQDPHFSLYNGCPQLQNPANAGSEAKVRVSMNQRNQWNKNSNGFQTSALSFDLRLIEKNKRNLSLGGFAFRDIGGGGATHLNSFNLGLSYRIKITSNQSLCSGFGLGFTQHRIGSNYQWSEQYDGIAFNKDLPSGENDVRLSSGFFDAGLGILWEFDNKTSKDNSINRFCASTGFSIFHPHRPLEHFITQSNVERRVVAHGLLKYFFLQNKLFARTTIQHTFQGKQMETIFGLSMAYVLSDRNSHNDVHTETFISLGLLHRMNDAIIPQISLGWNKLNLNLSYDITMNKYSQAKTIRNAFEIGIGFQF